MTTRRGFLRALPFGVILAAVGCKKPDQQPPSVEAEQEDPCPPCGMGRIRPAHRPLIKSLVK